MPGYKKTVLCVAIFAVAFFAKIAINIACGPEPDPYDYYVSFFNNAVSGEEYEPFFFTQLQNLYSEEETSSEAQINSQEWANYLHVKKDDVLKVMYQADTACQKLLTNLNRKNFEQLPDSLQKNSFLQGLIKNKKALQYYNFAKNCEPLASSAWDLWNPETRDTLAMTEAGAESLKLLNKVKRDPFLKLRYAYQAARMYHYASDYDRCKEVYQKWIEHDKSSSPVKGWAMALYAGATRKSGNSAQAAYLFSRVFHSNPERRVQAYKNYHYIRPKTDSVLQLARSNTEKASIWAIESFGNAGRSIHNLQEVYRNAPESTLNGALLGREVNKLEQNLIKERSFAKIYYWSYSSEENGNDSSRNTLLKELGQLRNFALKMAEDKKYPQPELGTITAAYLSWMENKDDLAATYLARLNPDLLPARLKDQYQITALLIQAGKIKKGSSFKEEELLPSLQWLDEKRSWENDPKIHPEAPYKWGEKNRHFTLTARNFYQQILAPAYLEAGDTAKAALAMVKAGLGAENPENKDLFKTMDYQCLAFWQQYLSPATMKQLENYKNTPQKGAYIRYITQSLAQLNDIDFYELFGTAYLRTHNYSKALIYFHKIPTNSLEYYNSSYGNDTTSFANPFIETINDYPRQYSSTPIDKESFAKEMVRLQKLVRSDKKNAALYYYKMANAIYQTGHFGNSWFLISYQWDTWTNNTKPEYDYDDDFKLARTAKTLYLKARSLSKNANFKAKCTFMLAKCEQKMIIYNGYTADNFNYYGSSEMYKDYIIANFNNPYFKELKTRHNKAPFYKIAENECSYFREFINHN